MAVKETDDDVIAVIKRCLERPIAYHPIFARIGGGALAGLFLSQAWYWQQRTKSEDGYFYKENEEWQMETGLTEAEIKGARLKLRERNILFEKYAGMPRQLFFKLDEEKIFSLIKNPPARMKNLKMVRPPIKRKLHNKQIEQSIESNLHNQEKVNCTDMNKQIAQSLITETTQRLLTENKTENKEDSLRSSSKHKRRAKKAEKITSIEQDEALTNEPLRFELTEERRAWVNANTPEVAHLLSQEVVRLEDWCNDPEHPERARTIRKRAGKITDRRFHNWMFKAREFHQQRPKPQLNFSNSQTSADRNRAALEKFKQEEGLV